MDYRVKKVGDDWEFLPKKERDEKREYENITIKINRREKKIERMMIKLKEDKEQLREWKKDRTQGYNNMVKYHKKFLPSFSIYLDDDGFGNPQWGMWVSIGGKRKNIYIGTVKDVSYLLDLLENNVPHYNKNNFYKDGPLGHYGSLIPNNLDGNDDKDIILSKIETYICDVIKKKMLGILRKDENLDNFFNKKLKIKGTDILYDVYKKTPHFEPPQKEREKKKGGTLRPLKVGKNKIW